VVVAFFGPSTVDHEVATSFLRQLKAELANDKVELCTEEPYVRSAYYASLRVTWTDGSVDLDVLLKTPGQQTRLRRNVEVLNIPREGWALALAIESDEMVRTGWARLDTKTNGVPKKPAVWWPAPRIKGEPLAAPLLRPSPRMALETGFFTEHYSRGPVLVGPTVQGRLLTATPWQLRAHLGLREVQGNAGYNVTRMLQLGVGVDRPLWTSPSHNAGTFAGPDASLGSIYQRAGREGNTGTVFQLGGRVGGWISVTENSQLRGEALFFVPLFHSVTTQNFKGIGAGVGLTWSVVL